MMTVLVLSLVVLLSRGYYYYIQLPYMSAGPTDPEGRLSNFGQFQNCTFMGNVAREYGAAIGINTLLHFQDMVNILPLEIDSW